ncbi:NAD(P)-binding protein [Hyalangium rubrum]|uniref:NAD(P)-binding protein n=1 Tax=Hyalangium rubrum TaxID=3103134 RepID=A0ABU5H5D0_9BACT|nr:NAD(P)-binding protein [Hyalangium sp. s54d21]MDY7228013.1 NAD(P)-binding protein [Hyalangium sp. s54d21]
MKKKVAVLGGGAGALTTAYYLSRTPELREEYEVTVYQVGWRLGGKGASGRGPHGRIEEHGLHIFWGFYENAFSLMRECYRVMDRPKSMPLATFEQAFAPRDLIAMEDFVNGRWQRWVVSFPSNSRQPGEGDDSSTSWQIIEQVLGVARQVYSKLKGGLSLAVAQGHTLTAQELGSTADGEELLEQAYAQVLLATQPQLASATADGITETVLKLLRTFLNWIKSRIEYLIESNFLLYQLYVGLDFLIANLVGILADGVLSKGFNSIEGQDYREWLEKHGASAMSLRSVLARTIYDAAMSMVDGDPDRQLIGAGSALRALLRIGLTYQGHVAYEFTGSMGDTIFVPLYEACRKQGVRFEFFHRVEEVIAERGGPGGKPRVTRVRVGRQVDLKDPKASYEPFIYVKNLPCWPDKPLYDQIVQGDKLIIEGIDLESFYTPWPSVEERVLEVGKDFDQVVFGIPVASVPFLCPTLMELNPAWRRMVDQVATIQTQAFQIWTTKDLSALGWTVGSPMLTGYVEPLDTWADMTSLLPREGWAQPNAPRTSAYFCGPMPGPSRPPPPTDHGYPARQKELARQAALSFLRNDISVLWPRSTQPNNPAVFDWSLLVPSNGAAGEGRFGTQYWRANVDPSERYTLALPGTEKARIRPDQTGFENLTVCGDWVDNGFYIGAAEGAVISGMLAFRAVTKQPLRISGEAFWYR